MFLATFDVTLVPYFFPVCFYLVFVCLKLLLLITITTLYFITFKPTTRHESYILCAVFIITWVKTQEKCGDFFFQTCIKWKSKKEIADNDDMHIICAS